ncbi:MAG: glycerophosphodiester phosphodiesterase family protein [Herbinix sp.]|nr:glycerophosphodiester phosphodiesterase family protein [Herbinix sp.]
MVKYIRSLKRNILLVIIIEMLSLFVYTYVIFPFCQMVLERVMRSQGYGYFFDNNILGVIKNIWILLTVIGIVLFLGLCFYVEIMVLVNAIINTNQTIRNILKKSILSTKKLLSPFGIYLIIISFFLSTIIHFNLLSRIVQNLGLVEYIKYNFMNNQGIAAIMFILLIAILFLLLRYLFVYPIFSNGNLSVKKSFFLSIKLMRKNYIRTLLKLLLVNVLALGFFAFVYMLIILIVILAIKSSVVIRLQYATSMTVMDTINRLLVFFFSISMVIINLESAVMLCKRYSLEEPYIFSEVNINLSDKKNRIKKRGIWTLMILLSLVLYIQINDDFLHNFRLRTGYNPEGKRTEIFAHRGNSYTAPENTLSALKSAIEEKADGAEIDIQMTKDGEIVLMHDSSLYRTAGINALIAQLNYSQLVDIDVGSWFSPAFKGEKIPTLEEALELCKGELTLMIEVKSGHYEEYDIARRVVKNVEEMGMDQDVIVASFNLNVLKEVKKLNNSISTCLILRFAYGNIEEVEYVDIFSLESRFVQKGVIKSIRNGGKALAVWTVNESKQMAYLGELGVDAIITDHPVRAREIFYEDSVPGFLVDIISFMLR